MYRLFPQPPRVQQLSTRLFPQPPRVQQLSTRNLEVHVEHQEACGQSRDSLLRWIYSVELAKEMDKAARGASALSSGNFASAITNYTEAIEINPTAVNYYIQRSIAYTRLSPADHEAALRDAEIAVALATKRMKRELIGDSQLRRAIALFGLERYADTKQCLAWAKQYNEKEKTIVIWGAKVESKLEKLEEGDHRKTLSVSQVPDIETPTQTEASKSVDKHQEESSATATPEAVQTPASKIRHEWYQTHDSVIITLYCKGIPKDKATVEIKENSLEVSFPLPTGADFNFSLDPLHSSVDRMKSHYKIMSTKAEFTLAKSIPGQKWSSIENTASINAEDDAADANNTSGEKVKHTVAAANAVNAVPAYPTSSKSGPKDWDKVASDLMKRPKKAPKEGEEDAVEEPGIDEEEGDPTNNFFKTLYKGADDDTRRAMMKSYQESNGTALSTNWAEVGKGPVQTSPPEGMEAKRWDE